MSETGWTTLVLGTFSFLSASLTAVLAYYTAKIKTVTDQTHVAVNGNKKREDELRTELMDEVRTLKAEVLAMSKAKATADERDRRP